MLGHREIFGHLIMVLRHERWRIVLGAVDHACLHRAEDLVEAEGYAIAAQRVHGVDEQRIAHHADLEALEVGNGPDRPLVVVDVARAGVHPAQRDQAGLLVRGNLRQQFVADLAVDHLLHMLGVTEDERHVEDVDVVHDGADGADRNTGDLERAELGLLDHFLFAAKLHRGEHLDRQPAVGGGFQFLAHPDDGFDGRIAQWMNVRCLQHHFRLRKCG